MSTKQHVIFLTIISVMTLAMIGMAITLVLASNHNKLDNNMSVEYEIESPDLVINIVNENNIRSMIKGGFGEANPSYMSYDNTKEGNSYTAESLLADEEYDSGIGDLTMYGDCANYTFTFSTPSGKTTNPATYYFDGIEFFDSTYNANIKNNCSIQFNETPYIDINQYACNFVNYSEWEPGTILTITINDPGENRNSQYADYKEYDYVIEIKNNAVVDTKIKCQCTLESMFYPEEGIATYHLQPTNSTSYDSENWENISVCRLHYDGSGPSGDYESGFYVDITFWLKITNTFQNTLDRDLSLTIEYYSDITDTEPIYTDNYDYTTNTNSIYFGNVYNLHHRIVITIDYASTT